MNSTSMMDQKAYALTGVKEPPQPPISRLYSALDRLRKASGITTDIADRMCGSVPQADGSEVEVAPSGLFDQMEYIAREIEAAAGNITDEMTRISNRL